MTSTDKAPRGLVTHKGLNATLDVRDEIVSKEIDKFKVEVVDRVKAIERLSDTMSSLIEQSVALIALNNLLQPETVDTEVIWEVAKGPFWFQSTEEIAASAKLVGKRVRRRTVLTEEFEPAPERVEQAEQIQGQLKIAS